MYKITFNLKTPKSQTESLIFLFVTINNDRIKISTQQTIIPYLWDFNKKRPTISKIKIDKYKNQIPAIEEKLFLIKQHLNNLTAEITKYIVGKELENKEPSIHELKRLLNEFLSPSKATQPALNVIVNFLSYFIVECRNGVRKQPNGKVYRNSTIDTYQVLRNSLIEYQKKIKQVLVWEMIDKGFYKDFILWHEKNGCSTGYIGKLIKIIKSSMRISLEEGIHKNEEFRKRYFFVSRIHKKRVPLSKIEVETIEKLELPTNSILDLTRDIFLLGCYFGLRISDLKKIGLHNIKIENDVHILEINTVKTDHLVKIPINTKANQILKKYDFKLPKFSEQAINRNLKKIAQLIDLSSDRANYFTIHLSRHTFATMSYQIGIPSLYIMSVTGHKSERAFLNYINIKPNEAIEEFLKHEFFN